MLKNLLLENHENLEASHDSLTKIRPLPTASFREQLNELRFLLQKISLKGLSFCLLTKCFKASELDLQCHFCFSHVSYLLHLKCVH